MNTCSVRDMVDQDYMQTAAAIARQENIILQMVPPDQREPCRDLIHQRDRCVVALSRIKRAILDEGKQNGNT